jgi:hypothetical protein
LIAWVHDRLHLHLFPTGTQWPAPSLKRALTLIAMQACKFVFYLVWSAPLLLAVPLVWLWRYQTSQKNWRAGQVGQTWTTVPTWQRWFCFWWIAPATCFFVFGHMGTPGFIQVYLPGLCVLLCTYLLADAPQPAADPSAGQAPQTAMLRWPMALVLALSFAGLLFFVGARPFDPAAKGWRGMANLLLLQYTGTGIRQELALARSGIWPPSREIQAMIDAQTDQQTIETAKKVDLLPIPKQK